MSEIRQLVVELVVGFVAMPDKAGLAELLLQIRVYREQAEQARRLAAQITDRQAIENLRDHAAELDRRMHELETQLATLRSSTRA
jgi:hypothetical protein